MFSSTTGLPVGIYDKREKKQITGWLDIKCTLDPSKSNSEYYELLCVKLDNYNWLSNKVHLNHIRSLHHLIIELLGRFAGFVALFERDFIFLDRGSHSYRDNDPYHFLGIVNFHNLIDPNENTKTKEQEKIRDTEGNDLAKTYGTMTEDKRKEVDSILEKKRVFYRSNFFAPNFDVNGRRNYIAHFNYLTKTGNRRSILELLSDLRNLVGYDRKLKNAVAKSFITLLDRHGIEITFKPLHSNSHQFVINQIASKEINHLGGAIKKNQVHADYVEMVRALLEYKN